VLKPRDLTLAMARQGDLETWLASAQATHRILITLALDRINSDELQQYQRPLRSYAADLTK
jgi:hypothetical protein